jgi:hypothetical protein
MPEYMLNYDSVPANGEEVPPGERRGERSGSQGGEMAEQPGSQLPWFHPHRQLMPPNYEVPHPDPIMFAELV